MAPAPAPSNIRASVRWKQQGVYAGEDIECILTFTNTARPPGQEEKERDELHNNQQLLNGRPKEFRRQSYVASVASVPHSRQSSLSQSVAPSVKPPSVAGGAAAAQTRGHRPTLSLNVGPPSVRNGPQSAPGASRAPPQAVQGHGRSLSIMSLGSDRAVETPTMHSASVKRPSKAHGRSASMASISSARPPANAHPGQIVPRQPSPLYESSTPPTLAEGQNEQLPIRPTRRRPGTVSAGSTPQLTRQSSLSKSPGSTPQLNRQGSLSKSPTGQATSQRFQFPGPQAKINSPSLQQDASKSPRDPSAMHSAQKRTVSPRPPDNRSSGNLHPVSRVMSETASVDSPRASSEYPMSNHSDETVTSEAQYPSQQNGRTFRGERLSRQLSNASQRIVSTARPETLMMGYVQTMGYFVLDGSLVNAAPFEEVKRKGVQGGGGVVGVDRAKHTSGLFGAFSWGNIGESLGGLLGTDEQSSLAQMKATAGSKSIPLLSTPQNLLFVDLRLAPGESKSFAYRFPLPRGLPPSHKGRAIKVSYHLALGVQRPEGQTVKRIEIPFRVLGSYTSQGEILGHDLMSPYTLLQDAARSQTIRIEPSTPLEFPPKEKPKSAPQQGLEDFLRYTERLLDRAPDSQNPLASPTSPSNSSIRPMMRSQSLPEAPATIQEAVDLAVARANHLDVPGKQRHQGTTSANRFNINRAGQPVAAITILRPAYRLGESVIGTIDFTTPSAQTSKPTAQPIPTYAVLVELESAERVDASLALRSNPSIQRVTRRVHASTKENTLFARRIGFSLAIPSTATPTFETTGVSLVWRLRVEFITQRQTHGLGLDSGSEDGDVNDAEELLEELASDERGTTFIARERLVADSFEIAVPLKVYGVPAMDTVDDDGELLRV